MLKYIKDIKNVKMTNVFGRLDHHQVKNFKNYLLIITAHPKNCTFSKTLRVLMTIW